jgi:DNA-binding transcriptional LysR family regulator
MPTARNHRASKPQRAGAADEGAFDWEGARVFLEIGRTGSFRTAALALHQSINVIRRRFERLEKSVGAVLLTRHHDGVRLTPEGERVLATARHMESLTFELMRGDESIGASAGAVKLAATEGLGTFWIAPHLRDYHQKHPRTMAHLLCSMSPADVLRLEADIAVQLTRPEAKDLKIVKLGRMHVMPFVAKAYAERHGIPQSLGELGKHTLVYQVSDQVAPPQNLLEVVRGAEARGMVVMRTNISSAQALAILSGAGIGLMPIYVALMNPSLIPVDIEFFRLSQDIWLVYHPDAGRQARVKSMIEWLVEMFAPRRFPWFGDRFLHPKDFPRSIPGWEPPYRMG